MTDPVWSRSMKDGNDRDVVLSIMPRTDFGPPLGAQVGVRIETFDHGESVYEQTVGLCDADRFALAVALYKEGPLG